MLLGFAGLGFAGYRRAKIGRTDFFRRLLDITASVKQLMPSHAPAASAFLTPPF
jgi:hypothetical protein